MNKKEREAKQKELQAAIEELQQKIENFELDPDDYTDDYDETLRELGDVNIGDLTYDPAMVLKEIDPTAYRCGLLDYIDGLDKEDDSDYQALTEELEEMENELADLEEDE